MEADAFGRGVHDASGFRGLQTLRPFIKNFRRFLLLSSVLLSHRGVRIDLYLFISTICPKRSSRLTHFV